ncbi:MAG: hypothetical protein WDN00_01885 [Limisphaerales bacterium]
MKAGGTRYLDQHHHDQFRFAPRYYQSLDQTVLLTSGQIYEQHALVRSSGEPLKITLAYTDVPDFRARFQPLVNDLNLEVVGPDWNALSRQSIFRR